MRARCKRSPLPYAKGDTNYRRHDNCHRESCENTESRLPMKFGLVDLDTSHATAWLPLLREMGHEVTGVFDSRTVHPPGYAEEFAFAHSIALVHGSLEQMADAVDCAILLGCDWNGRIPKALPFVQAGKSLLIDKPLAGNVSDLMQLRDWIDAGARIAGGSSLRFCRETRDFLAQPAAAVGTPHTALCGCGHEEFFYGIHAVAMLVGIMGSGVCSVRDLGSGPQHRIQLNWAQGRSGFAIVGSTGNWMGFYATIVTEKGATQFHANTGHLYSALFEAVLPYLAGDTDRAPLAGRDLIEPELCLIAARHSRQNGGSEVWLRDLPLDSSYDNQQFLQSYRYF